MGQSTEYVHTSNCVLQSTLDGSSKTGEPRETQVWHEWTSFGPVPEVTKNDN
jgi:hypothetical protein